MFHPVAAAMNQRALMGVLMKIRSGIGPSGRWSLKEKQPTEGARFALLPPPPQIKATKVSPTLEPPSGGTQEDKEVVA